MQPLLNHRRIFGDRRGEGVVRALLLVEVVFVLIGLVGVALIYPPAALILAGFLGVVACERATIRRGERT